MTLHTPTVYFSNISMITVYGPYEYKDRNEPRMEQVDHWFESGASLTFHNKFVINRKS